MTKHKLAVVCIGNSSRINMLKNLCRASLLSAILFTAQLSNARQLTIEQLKAPDFGTLVIPMKGSEYVILTPSSDIGGTGTVLSQPQAGIYNIVSNKAIVANIDVQNPSSGVESASLRDFKGIFIAEDGEERKLSFPNVIEIPEGVSQLKLGFTLDYSYKIKGEIQNVEPVFDIVIEE